MRFARTIWHCAAFASVTTLSACDGRPALDVNYSGTLNERAVDDIVALFSDDTRRLVITSAGGEILSAIRLGRAVRERNMTVVVRGYCLSACAHFVFAPAKSKLIEPDALVGFHGTATAREELLERAGQPELAAVFSDAADREQELYSESSLASELLVQPLIEVAPICYDSRKGDPSSAYEFAVLTRATFFIPDRARLESWGVGEVEGFWPEDQPSLVQALSTMPKHFNMQFRLEAIHGSFADRLPVVDACPRNDYGNTITVTDSITVTARN
jgi:hypothetical protein